MAETAQQKNRRIRQEELRRQLSEQCRVQHILDNIKKIEELPPGDEASFELSKIKTANEQRLKLINKYLPDLKQSEIIGDPDQPISHDHVVEFIGVDANTTSGED